MFEIEDAGHGGGEFAPAADFTGQVFSAFGGELVEAGLAIVGGDAPLGGNPDVGFETLESGIKRAVIDEEHIAGIELNGAGNSLPVLGAEGENAQNEEVERALQEGDVIFFVEVQHGSGKMLTRSTREYGVQSVRE